MGGCRCTFRECERRTLTHPDSHFFHFPYKNRERCTAWARNSGHPEFMDLPESALRNKVVCQEHFTEPNFMNHLRKSLTKFAVPTLFRIPGSREVHDYDVPDGDPPQRLIESDDGTLEPLRSTPEVSDAELLLSMSDGADGTQPQDGAIEILVNEDYLLEDDVDGGMLMEFDEQGEIMTLTTADGALVYQSTDADGDAVGPAQPTLHQYSAAAAEVRTSAAPKILNGSQTPAANAGTSMKRLRKLTAVAEKDAGESEPKAAKRAPVADSYAQPAKQPKLAPDSPAAELNASHAAAVAEHELIAQRLRRELQDSAGELEALQRRFDEQLGELERLKTREQRARAEAQTLRDSVQQQRVTIDEQNDRIERLEQQAASTSAECESLRARKAEQATAMRTLEADARAQRQAAEASGDRLRSAEAAHAQAIGDLQARLAAQAKRLLEQQAEADRTAAALKTAVQQCRQQAESAATSTTTAQATVAAVGLTPLATPKPDASVQKLIGSLTKPQLFNGIRRYLNPSMIALVRMEMFGDAEREYKPDERQIAMELWSQPQPVPPTDGCVYEFMRSEWRFRLPPKADVQQWIRERDENTGNGDDWDDC